MNPSRSLRLRALVAVSAVIGATAAGVVTAGSAVAATSPVVNRVPGTVTDDVLPTAQMDGVAYSEAMVGNTVYVGGKFANARPAGAAPGVNTVARNNVMAFDVTTGVMTSWAPNLNNQVNAVAVSPDKTRLYVGGQFTTVDGQTRNRIAAFNAQTGALIANWVPKLGYIVKSIVATNTTVYVGGQFTNAGTVTRNRLAAFSATDASLLPWNPSADSTVTSMVLTPDGSKLIVGGAFQNLGTTPAYGLAAVDPTTGAVLPWAATSAVRDAGNNAAILSLSTDGQAVYGSGYVYGAGGNLEGAFSANPSSGALNWIEDCHGDTYGVFSTGAAVYSVSHSHYCGNVGGFPQTNPWTFQRALSWTPQAAGTIGHDPLGYYDWYGYPSPSMQNWFPELAVGSYTGVTQAAWSVTGNSQYVVLGGEFPKVNNIGQQGLVRFAVNPPGGPKDGPRLSGSSYTPSVTSLSAGTARVSFPSNWDRDDKTLSYSVIRNSNTATPVYTTTAQSTFWNRPNLGFTDRGLTPGSTVTYRVIVSDPAGNQVSSSTVSTTVSSSSKGGAYANDVTADGASNYWRLGESSGGTAYDYAGFDDLQVNSGVGRGAIGAINGDTDTASTFDGTANGFASTTNAIDGPNVFTEEAWVKTTSTSGGKIVSFGDQSTGNSNNYDRHLYMDTSGKLFFGVYNNGSYTINTATAYNDGGWHHVVGTLDPTGMTLYVDGKRVGRNTGTTLGQPYTGYWRVGGDSPWAGNGYLAGSIDDVAIYPTALTLAQVQKHYTDSGRTLPGANPPADAYGSAVYNTGPDAYYRMDDTSGPTAADASANQVAGTYFGSETFGVASPVTSGGKAVTFSGTSGSVLTSGPVTDPKSYSEELWFSTTTTNGGKLIGFGSSGDGGTSGGYDRHVYMETDGQLTFGTWTGAANTTTSPNSYNDGAWHHLVATQGADGMKLYVDDQLVGTNAQTGNQDYDGYWRVGGDTAWNGTTWFAGTIDEVAVYSSVLTPAQVDAHFHASPLGGPVNQAPTASFTATPSNLSVGVDASASSDPDGSIASYSWNWGDTTAAGSGQTASHTYGSAGTYTVTLTVTDNGGATATTTRSVTVAAANQPPTASFTATPSNLSVGVDASASSDPDGSIASYSWNWGDTTAAGSGQTASHTYGSAGTYTVTLTVTDNAGATATATRSVTVTAAAAAPIAADTFGRTTANGWGTAETGGAWSIGGPAAANWSVSGGKARVSVPLGSTATARLASVSAADTDSSVSMSLDQAPTGGGTMVWLGARRTGTSDYRVRAKVLATGKVQVSVGKMVGGTETVLGTIVTAPNLTYVPGMTLRMRLVVTGTSTVTLQGKVWDASTAEPTGWTATATDSSSPLGAGGVLVSAYESGSATNAPVTCTVDDLSVVAPTA